MRNLILPGAGSQGITAKRASFYVYFHDYNQRTKNILARFMV